METPVSERRSVYIADKFANVLDLRPDQGQEHGLSARLAAIMDRYAMIVARAMPKMSRAEWCLIMDACNGWATWSEAGETLMAGIALEVSDAISLNGLDEKWYLTREQGQALVARLQSLSTAETVAVVEAVERFWRRAEMDTDEALVAAGVALATE